MISKLLILIMGVSLLALPVLASDANVSFQITNYSPGDYYYWGISANSTVFPEPINATNYLHISPNQWLINPLGAANGDPFATYLYNGLACIFINIFAYVSGRTRIRFNLVWVAAFGLFFEGIGWMQTTYLLVSVGMAYAVIMYIRYSEEESTS